MENKKWTTQRILQFLAFTAMFIVMPALSWYYLRGGRDIRREAMAELKDFGKIPAFELADVDGQPFSEKDLMKKTVVFNFPKNIDAPLKQELLDQFDNRNDIQFVSFYPDSLPLVKQLFYEKFPKGNPHWIATAAPSPFDFSKKIVDLAAQSNIPMENLYVLADTNSVIRRFYDGTNRSDMVRLVQQIALIMPPK